MSDGQVNDAEQLAADNTGPVAPALNRGGATAPLTAPVDRAHESAPCGRSLGDLVRFVGVVDVMHSTGQTRGVSSAIMDRVAALAGLDLAARTGRAKLLPWWAWEKHSAAVLAPLATGATGPRPRAPSQRARRPFPVTFGTEPAVALTGARQRRAPR